MEAGFSSGGPIATLDDPAFLNMVTDDDYQSVGLRLLGVESMTAEVSDTLGLDLVMAPGPLHAKVAAAGLALDAKIYDAPRELSLGLAPDGAFLIEGSAPIDLITMVISDTSGALLGATDVNVRIEQIPRKLSVGLVGEQIAFDGGGDVIGLLEMVASSGPQPVIPAGQDGLVMTLNETDFVMATRLHGLRNITASLDFENMSFALDTVAGAILFLDLDVQGIVVNGVIDHLVPNMKMGVEADETGALAGLKYSASQPTNSIVFNIPGFADFSAANPLPTRMGFSMGDVMKVEGSDLFTFNLNAELDGVTATITNLRVRLMEFGNGEIDPNLPADQIPFYFNTTEVTDECPDGCTYPIPSGRLELGPVELSGLEVTTRFDPGGFAADHATVYFLISGAIIPSVSNIGQVGTVHCAAGTGLSAITILTISMTSALCASSIPLAGLQTASLVAPQAVEGGSPVAHVYTARNAGPSAAANVRIEATYNDALGDPAPSCSTGTTPVLGAGSVSCQWAASTAVNATRSMTLTWPTAVGTPSGTTVTANYQASSTSAGPGAGATASTGVYPTVAALRVVDVTAPTVAVAGAGDVSHRVDVANDGPSPAPNLRVAAAHNGALGSASVVCSADGVADGPACLWAGDTAAGGARWAEFSWAAPSGTPNSVLEATYAVSSDAPALNTSAGAQTAVAAAEANLVIVAADTPERVQPGDEIAHSVSVRNGGPSPATALRVLADYSDALGEPEVTCTDGGVPSVFTEIGRARCAWLGATSADAERGMTLSWAASGDTPLGTTVGVTFRAASDTPGASPTETTATLIDEPIRADLEITALSVPPIWATGANLVHRVDVRNAGPEPADEMQIAAVLPTSVIANPTVACSTGGVGSTADGVARCTFAGATSAGTRGSSSSRGARHRSALRELVRSLRPPTR